MSSILRPGMNMSLRQRHATVMETEEKENDTQTTSPPKKVTQKPNKKTRPSTSKKDNPKEKRSLVGIDINRPFTIRRSDNGDPLPSSILSRQSTYLSHDGLSDSGTTVDDVISLDDLDDISSDYSSSTTCVTPPSDNNAGRKATSLDQKPNQPVVQQTPLSIYDINTAKLTPGASSPTESSKNTDSQSLCDTNEHPRLEEPFEVGLYDRVEYDMDEQDQHFLDIINKDRVSKNLGTVSCNIFETVIDALEKEWYILIKDALSKLIPPPLPADFSCTVCARNDYEDGNAIIFCDGCNVAVHQVCYGVPHIPDGQWFCRKCTLSPKTSAMCAFCPNQGGALKPIKGTNNWAHVFCAIWIPEVDIGNGAFMEPIQCVEAIPKDRWKLVCSLCKERAGVCIQCDHGKCRQSFHVTCARKAGFSIPTEGTELRMYCKKHEPTTIKQVLVDKNRINKRLTPHPKSKRNNKKKLQTPTGIAIPLDPEMAQVNLENPDGRTPVAPDFILTTLETLPCLKDSVDLLETTSLITTLARYWSLKRAAQYNAPLIRRLYLKPWPNSMPFPTQPVNEGIRPNLSATKKPHTKLATTEIIPTPRDIPPIVKKRRSERIHQKTDASASPIRILRSFHKGAIPPVVPLKRKAMTTISNTPTRIKRPKASSVKANKASATLIRLPTNQGKNANSMPASNWVLSSKQSWTSVTVPPIYGLSEQANSTLKQRLLAAQPEPIFPITAPHLG